MSLCNADKRTFEPLIGGGLIELVFLLLAALFVSFGSFVFWHTLWFRTRVPCFRCLCVFFLIQGLFFRRLLFVGTNRPKSVLAFYGMLKCGSSSQWYYIFEYFLW